ncbi:hypothetical protein LOD99_2081 [Oopsacas minuta]|uniref:Uncharacterized protein n=1 Tax=Oopsacas minuta TaxID=111878 RepID=A0AAV7K2V6_9METZ|nr:hypothetical protein LOD99_2081 [Oopsacas minuta]
MSGGYNTDYISYIYGLLVLFGGIFGYIKSHSLPSLLVGVSFGLLILYGGYQTSLNKKDATISIVLAILVALIMGYRFMLTGRFMPGGFITLVSVGQALRLFLT